MKITKSEFSEKRRREAGDEEETQEMAAIRPLQELQRAEFIQTDPDPPTNVLSERIEEGPVTMSKEAPDQSAMPEQGADESLVAMPEPMPDEQTTPAASHESSPENSVRPTPTPRKNVIPSRRATFENGNRVQPSVKRNTWSVENAQKAASGPLPEQQMGPAAPAASTAEDSQKRDAADLPTNVSMPAVGLDAAANKLEAPPSWKQAPQTPVTWQSVPEMPISWQPEQGTPTLAEIEPVWGQASSSAEMEPARENAHEREGAGTDDDEHIRKTAAMETHKMAALSTPAPGEDKDASVQASPLLNELPQTPVPAVREGMSEQPTTPLPLTPLPLAPVKPLPARREILTGGRAAFLVLLLAILVVNVSATGFHQFFGPQGWGSVFNSSNNKGQNLLNQLRQPTITPGAKGQPTAVPLTPKQIVDKLLANMSLDQKLGQMIMVSFNTPYYSSQLDTMITQYHVGSVIEYLDNIESKSQLTTLNQQIQQHGDLPMIVAIDQEGGYVDRLKNLDGSEISATTLGATGDPQKAYQQGMTDAQNLASYGFNLNIAPVVDIGNPNIYNGQLVDRTFGNDSATVTQMAGAYLNGLQQSGKVLGTIKHFPGGLADTPIDPHLGLPHLSRSLNDFDSIDWAPYKSLISKGNIYSIMITHEIVPALDPSLPSSLSPKVVSILRNQLGFKGVIITDGLEMGALAQYYSLKDAARLAVEAGDDLMMDPGSPTEVGQMIDGIKQAMSSGAITQQRIDASVERILLFKYQMGLLNING